MKLLVSKKTQITKKKGIKLKHQVIDYFSRVDVKVKNFYINFNVEIFTFFISILGKKSYMIKLRLV